jgi:HK97 family phage major capsid protein
MYAEPKATQDELDDADFDIEAWLVRNIGMKLARLEANAFVVGTGVAKPRGFLTYASGTPTATAFNVIEQTKTGVNGAFHATLPGDVFLTTIGLLKAAFRARARWSMNRTTEAAVRKQKDGQNNYLWQPSFQAGVPSLLCGHPVSLFEDMPAIATGSLSIALADFLEAYQIVDRRGMTVLRDPYTAKPYVKFYTTRRVGGDVVNFEAVKLIDFSV